MKFPRWTLLICGMATVLFFVPSLGSALIYDRASIQGGAWWLLLTGNLVHLSVTHFASDVLALLAVGTMIEQRGVRYLWLVYLAAAVTIGLTVYLALPALRFYAGLSGIVTAAVVYLCMDGLRDPGAWRWLCMPLLALVGVKIGLEFALGGTFLSATTSQPFVPVPVSHLAGACAALIVCGIRPLLEPDPARQSERKSGQLRDLAS